MYQFVNVGLGVEAETVHSGVELDVYGVARDSLAPGSLDKGVE